MIAASCIRRSGRPIGLRLQWGNRGLPPDTPTNSTLLNLSPLSIVRILVTIVAYGWGIKSVSQYGFETTFLLIPAILSVVKWHLCGVHVPGIIAIRLTRY